MKDVQPQQLDLILHCPLASKQRFYLNPLALRTLNLSPIQILPLPNAAQVLLKLEKKSSIFTSFQVKGHYFRCTQCLDIESGTKLQQHTVSLGLGKYVSLSSNFPDKQSIIENQYLGTKIKEVSKHAESVQD